MNCLSFLEVMMKDLDFSIKDFFRVIYNTETYQREAETMTPTLTQVDTGTYHFPGPILRRMSAEQLWDSLVTLTTENPEGKLRRGWEQYKEVMHTDTSTLKTVAQIEAYKNKYRTVGGLSDGEEHDDGPQCGTHRWTGHGSCFGNETAPGVPVTSSGCLASRTSSSSRTSSPRGFLSRRSWLS